MSSQEHGEIILAVEEGSVFIVSSFKGDKDLEYVCVQANQAALYHDSEYTCVFDTVCQCS